MKRVMKQIAVLMAAVCCLLCQGCDGGYDCALDNIAYNRVKFYTIDGHGMEKEYAFPDPLTVTMMVNGSEAVVVNYMTNAKELTLPMSYTSECDTLIMNFFDRYIDTLYIGHYNIPLYQSMECGVIMHHRLTGVSYTGNFLDSMAVKSAEINFDYNENIKLYFVE